jgi:hypothetical protein
MLRQFAICNFHFVATIRAQREPGTDALLAIGGVLISRPMQLAVYSNSQRAAVARQHAARISPLTPP